MIFYFCPYFVWRFSFIFTHMVQFLYRGVARKSSRQFCQTFIEIQSISRTVEYHILVFWLTNFFWNHAVLTEAFLRFDAWWHYIYTTSFPSTAWNTRLWSFNFPNLSKFCTKYNFYWSWSKFFFVLSHKWMITAWLPWLQDNQPTDLIVHWI